MLRNHSDDKISDRFITGRNGERERILDKFKVTREELEKYNDLSNIHEKVKLIIPSNNE